jgi:hypothetical protein
MANATYLPLEVVQLIKELSVKSLWKDYKISKEKKRQTFKERLDNKLTFWTALNQIKDTTLIRSKPKHDTWRRERFKNRYTKPDGVKRVCSGFCCGQIRAQKGWGKYLIRRDTYTNQADAVKRHQIISNLLAFDHVTQF